MARYLTSAKLGLLSLISLYADGVVPTAAAVPVLSFIISNIFSVNAAGSSYGCTNGLKPSKFVVSIDDFQELCIGHGSGIPGRSVWDLLLKKLWEINSFDALHQFFDDLTSLLAKSREETLGDGEMDATVGDRVLLSRVSPLGAFVRRTQLEFMRMPFHDALELWKGFVSFRQPTWATWRKRNPLAGKGSFDVNLEGGMLEDRLTNAVYGRLRVTDAQPPEQFSTDDVERLLEFQVDEMQKAGNRMSEDVRHQFRRMLDSNVMIPSLSHYVKFLDSWRAGDYPSSFDNLHRYFDYTMQNRDRTYYQYALLNLAILQADFGCYAEAVAAMQEAISAARENKDMGCLNFSLSWLYHFGKAHPNEVGGVGKKGMMSIEREGLAFLKTKAKETGMWSLWSTSLLSESKLSLANGESIATAFENIVKSSHLNVIKGMTNVLGSQMLLQSSLWSRLGVSQLAWSYCDIFRACFSKQAPLEDMLKSTCRSAYFMAQKGRYEDAMSRMDEVDSSSLRILKNYQYWTMFAGLLKLKRLLHRDNLRAAERLLNQLLAQEPSEPDIAFEIHVFELDFLMRQGSYPTALEKLESLATRLSSEDADVLSRLRLLTMKAQLFSRCGVPLKGFSAAVRAASVAWRTRLLPVLWEALTTIAGILVHLEEFEAAARLVSAIMPQVIECEDSILSAQAYSVLVDAEMGLAGQAATEPAKRKEHVVKANEFIGSAFDEFSSIADINGQCEAMAKKATMMRVLGDVALANDYAAKYLDLKSEWRKELELEP
ncbi:MAG: anaphase promoting complex subunit 5 [Lichina confinis]|nr:MAG: anaphase promoting complex subunit 5 [Lichina confinis]